MFKKLTYKTEKANNTHLDKRGFTLAELTVVMALLAIVVTMIVTFSALMGSFAKDEKAEFDFLEQVSALKNSLDDWISEHDVQGAYFIANNNELNTVIIRDIEGISFSNGILECNDEIIISGLDEIGELSFSSSGKLIKCTATRSTDDENKDEISFVFAVRIAEIR